MEKLNLILDFIVRSLIHIWPYLLITIPVAVIINLSNASKYINKAFGKNPVLSVILATAIGAFSPFCSCGVIPVITSLLVGGVPLGPVMSFWIASPSMDPEIFFLSVSAIGWELSVWRLVSTLVISLSAGWLTYRAQAKGFLMSGILRPGLALSGAGTCCTGVKADAQGCSCGTPSALAWIDSAKRILKEIWKAAALVTLFMTLAFLINALIKFFLPEDLLSGIMGKNSRFSVLIATLVGIPFYTSNLTALPLVNGLISLGMNSGAALAFLIAGPVTTLPAMMAVWGIVKPRVFLIYLSFGLAGSFIAGTLFNILN